MISKTKYKIADEKLKELFDSAGIPDAHSFEPLGAGEYNAVFCAVSGGNEYVIKIAPPPEVEVLTYEKNIMQSEVYWYRLIEENTDIRIPQIYFEDFSRKIIPCDYFIMEKVSGQTLNKVELSTEEREYVRAEISKMLAQLHGIRGEKFGYIQNGLYDNWYLALKSFFQNLIIDCERVGKKSKRGRRSLELVDECKDILEKVECTLVNYDLWDVNIVCKRENEKLILYWIDPERSFWGDRIFDFICLDFMLAFDKKTAAKEAYNRYSSVKITNTREERIRFAFAQLLMGLIQESEKYYRYTPLNFGWWRNVLSCKMIYKRGFSELKTLLK